MTDDRPRRRPDRAQAHEHAAGRRRARGQLRRPRLRPVLHRPHGHDRVGRRPRLARRPARAVRPALARPGGHGAALRPGDLRGAQGLPAARRLDRDVPAGGQRPRASSARPRRLAMPRAARGAVPGVHRRAGHARTATGCRPAPSAACTCGRSCSPPRSGLGVRPANAYLYVLIASPAGAYFPRGLKPVTVWLSEDYTRAAPGGTGEAKCAGNYAASLVAQAQAAEQRLRPGGVAGRRRAPLGRGDGRHEPVLRLRVRRGRPPASPRR